jgi:hypothetical protein
MFLLHVRALVTALQIDANLNLWAVSCDMISMPTFMKISHLVQKIRQEQVYGHVISLIFPYRIRQQAKCSINVSLNVKCMKRRYVY